MARVRAGIINWPSEGHLVIPSSDINSDLNMTIVFLKVNFLRANQLEPQSREIHPGNPELDTGNWPQTQQLD